MRLLLILLIWVLPQAGMAGTVRVRSGDHSGFSRLALDLGHAPRWSTVSLDGGYRMQLAADDIRFDTGAVDRTMGRDRFSWLRADPRSAVLDFGIGCLCRLEIWVLRGTILVIDLYDADAEGGLPLENIRLLSSSIQAPHGPQPPVAETPHTAVPQTELQHGEGELPTRTDNAAVAVEHAITSGQALGAAVSKGSFDILTDAMRRAADAGLVDLAGIGAAREAAQTGHETEHSPPGPGSAPHGPATGAAAAQADHGLSGQDGGHSAQHGAEVPPTAPDASGQLQVTTAPVRDLRELVERFEGRHGPADCPRSADLDVPSWGAEKYDLGDTRARMMGEFDAADEDAPRELVRRYIYLSFGAEARQILTAFPLSAPETALLSLMARVVDGETAEDQELARDLASCPSRAALWGLLALNEPGRGLRLDEDKVIAALSELPLHLRIPLATTAVDRLLAIAEVDLARRAWGTVERAVDAEMPAQKLAVAQIELAEGATQQAMATLATIGGTDTGVAAAATATRIEQGLRDGGIPDPALIEAAAAYAFELRGTLVSIRLKRAEIRALILDGEFDRARGSVLDAIGQRILTAEAAAPLRTELYRAAAERAGPAQAVRLGIAAALELGSDPEAAAARRAMADRLLDLGLAEPALALLHDLPGAAGGDALRLAQAALLRGDPAAAGDLLRSIGPDADRALLAQTHAAAGLHVAAAEDFALTGASDKAYLEAVRTGDLNLAMQHAAEPSETALRLISDAPSPAPDLPILARNRGLVKASETTRDAVNALISGLEMPQ